jgi:hypothetical protein
MVHEVFVLAADGAHRLAIIEKKLLKFKRFGSKNMGIKELQDSGCLDFDLLLSHINGQSSYLI